MLALPLLLLLGAAAAATQRAPPLEAVGWWVGDGEGGQASMNRLEQFFDLDLYTIIRPQFGPAVAANGSCTCSLSSSAPVRRLEPNVSVHSSKGRLLVIKVEDFS